MTQTELSVTDVTAIKITRSSVVNALHIKLETRGEAVEVTAYAARDLERLVHGQGEQGIPIVFDESEGGESMDKVTNGISSEEVDRRVAKMQRNHERILRLAQLTESIDIAISTLAKLKKEAQRFIDER